MLILQRRIGELSVAVAGLVKFASWCGGVAEFAPELESTRSASAASKGKHPTVSDATRTPKGPGARDSATARGIVFAFERLLVWLALCLLTWASVFLLGWLAWRGVQVLQGMN